MTAILTAHDLPNLGPKSREMLAKAGFSTLGQPQALGSVRAYLAVKRSGCNPSLNLLWAIEGLLSNRHWRDVAKYDRLPLLLQLDTFEAQESACTSSLAETFKSHCNA